MNEADVICGLWVNEDFEVHRSIRNKEGVTRVETSSLKPFIWANEEAFGTDVNSEALEGMGLFRYLLHFDSPEAYKAASSDRSLIKEHFKPLEAQFLMANEARLFDGMLFSDLKRIQVDIETACPSGGFSNPKIKEDRVLAIGIQKPNGESLLLELEERTDVAERALLEKFCQALAEIDPDVIEGHNIYSFDLNYLYQRSKKLKVKPIWGRFAQAAKMRKSRIRIAERWVDYIRFDLPGRTVFDTWLAIQLFDISARELPAYGLKHVALYFGISKEEDRTYIEGSQIQYIFDEDREQFRSYLLDDLRETKGISDRLLPTYFAQTQNFPMTFQDITLRGTSQRVDSVLLEKYYHGKASLPEMPEGTSFEGGFSKSFETGVYENVLHYDVASLYPSLLMYIGRNPGNDSLGVFMPLLENLRSYRLEYKKKAIEESDASLRSEYNARQQAYKILINSFYGYLGFSQARFGDPGLAAEVTRRGRELLKALIDEFQKLDCTVLEADTDGIYLTAEKYWKNPDALLEKVAHVLPEGIQLEYDGKYESMFCYKAKNYALFDGDKVILKGSALRSRGIEPFLKSLSDQMISWLLGREKDSPLIMLEDFKKQILEGKMPVTQLAKNENLSQNPEAYKKKIDAGGKPRRASLEVALQMDPQPKMGSRVHYYIGPREKGKTTDWSRAVPLDHFDAEEKPYCPKYYLKKLDEWEKRYKEFLDEEREEQAEQQELF